MTRTPLSRSKCQRWRLPGRFTHRGLNEWVTVRTYWAWKLLLRCVCSAARKALGRPPVRRGAGAYRVATYTACFETRRVVENCETTAIFIFVLQILLSPYSPAVYSQWIVSSPTLRVWRYCNRFQTLLRKWVDYVINIRSPLLWLRWWCSGQRAVLPRYWAHACTYSPLL